jgi:hypothetical protein
MNELQKELEGVLNSIKSLESLGNDISDDQVEKLDGLNKQAVKLRTRIEAAEQKALADAADKVRIENEKKEAVAEAVKAERAANRRLQMGQSPHQSRFSSTGRYDGLDAVNLALVIDVAAKLGISLGKGVMNAMALKVAELKDNNTDENRESVAYIKSAFKGATGIDPTPEGVSNAIKTEGDPDYSTATGYGAEWVGTAYSAMIWEKIRADCRVAALIPSEVIPDGYSSQYWPLESTDLTFYKVAEATAGDATLKVPSATVTSSKLATAQKQITVGKLGARGIYSGEMEEDSLIRFAPQLRQQLQVTGTEYLESLIIDGDTETSNATNINSIDGATGTPAATDWFLLTNGFRKLALITNATNARSAGGALVIEDYAQTLKLMGTAGIAAADPSKLAFIVDGNVHYANMLLPEVKTKDVNSAATVENGFVKKFFGVDVIPSWQMHRQSAKRMTNTAGKISVTDSNNLYGEIIAVRWDQWKQAFKRRMTMTTTYIANADAYEIVALMRWGLAYRDNEASALTYYVGV